MYYSTFLTNKIKRVGGRFDDIKNIFSVTNDNGVEYFVNTIDNLLEFSNPEILYSKKHNLNKIKITSLNNGIKVFIDGYYKIFDISNKDDSILIIKINDTILIDSFIMYIDYAIGTNNNTYIENNVISCNYNTEVVIGEMILDGNEYGVEIFSIPTYAEIRRFSNVEYDKLEYDIDGTFKLDENVSLYIDNKEKDFGIINKSDNINNLSINMKKFEDNSLLLKEKNLNNRELMYSIDSKFKFKNIDLNKIKNNFTLLKKSNKIYGTYKIVCLKNANVELTFDIYVDGYNIEVLNVYMSDNMKDYSIEENNSNILYLYGFNIEENEDFIEFSYNENNISFTEIRVYFDNKYIEPKFDIKKFNLTKSIMQKHEYFRRIPIKLCDNYKVYKLFKYKSNFIANFSILDKDDNILYKNNISSTGNGIIIEKSEIFKREYKKIEIESLNNNEYVGDIISNLNISSLDLENEFWSFYSNYEDFVQLTIRNESGKKYAFAKELSASFANYVSPIYTSSKPIEGIRISLNRNSSDTSTFQMYYDKSNSSPIGLNKNNIYFFVIKNNGSIIDSVVISLFEDFGESQEKIDLMKNIMPSFNYISRDMSNFVLYERYFLSNEAENISFEIFEYDINYFSSSRRKQIESSSSKNILKRYTYDNSIIDINDYLYTNYNIEFQNIDECFSFRISSESDVGKVCLEFLDESSYLSISDNIYNKTTSNLNLGDTFSLSDKENLISNSIALDNNPVGTVISLFKYSENVNGNIKRNYLKMDGSEIPYKKEYDALLRLFGGRYVERVNPKVDYKLYRPIDGKVVWWIKNKSIKEYFESSDLDNGIELIGNENVILYERFWNGYSINKKSGWNDIVSGISNLIGTRDRAVGNGICLSAIANTNLSEAGDFYYSQNSGGLSSSTFSINDKISAGYYQLPGGNENLFTIYNHTTSQYLISGTTSNYSKEGFNFYHRNYDSMTLVGIINSSKKFLLGFAIDGRATITTSQYDNGIEPSFENYSFHNQIYLPDMTSNDVFLGGGSNSGSYNRQSLPNTKGDYLASGWTINTNCHTNCYGSIYADGTNNAGAFSSGVFTDKYISTKNLLDKAKSKRNTTTGVWGLSSNQLSISDSYYATIMDFNMNRCNPIYQDNSNVRPNHYVVEYWIKYK